MNVIIGILSLFSQKSIYVFQIFQKGNYKVLYLEIKNNCQKCFWTGYLQATFESPQIALYPLFFSSNNQS